MRLTPQAPCFAHFAGFMSGFSRCPLGLSFRRSRRSLSGFVAVARFSSFAAASRFARSWGRRLPARPGFCAVRAVAGRRGLLVLAALPSLPGVPLPVLLYGGSSRSPSRFISFLKHRPKIPFRFETVGCLNSLRRGVMKLLIQHNQKSGFTSKTKYALYVRAVELCRNGDRAKESAGKRIAVVFRQGRVRSRVCP